MGGKSQRSAQASGGGLCSEPGNDVELADAVLALALAGDRAAALGQSGRA